VNCNCRRLDLKSYSSGCRYSRRLASPSPRRSSEDEADLEIAFWQRVNSYYRPLHRLVLRVALHRLRKKYYLARMVEVVLSDPDELRVR